MARLGCRSVLAFGRADTGGPRPRSGVRTADPGPSWDRNRCSRVRHRDASVVCPLGAGSYCVGVSTAITAARRLAAALEPIADQAQFSPECHASYAALGFPPSPGMAGRTALPDKCGFFTSRGSVMGDAHAEVVAAAFAVCSTRRKSSLRPALIVGDRSTQRPVLGTTRTFAHRRSRLGRCAARLAADRAARLRLIADAYGLDRDGRATLLPAIVTAVGVGDVGWPRRRRGRRAASA